MKLSSDALDVGFRLGALLVDGKSEQPKLLALMNQGVQGLLNLEIEVGQAIDVGLMSPSVRVNAVFETSP
ncbi:MAG: hypothetical protein C4523_06890 [Myxococcales bacterium]|nr:MAG: hypothetical protein C4523_06890 [Myxococcales bacterium]